MRNTKIEIIKVLNEEMKCEKIVLMENRDELNDEDSIVFDLYCGKSFISTFLFKKEISILNDKEFTKLTTKRLLSYFKSLRNKALKAFKGSETIEFKFFNDEFLKEIKIELNKRENI